ncbi:MAG TPA: lipoate--protein ligase family protein [Candidatus Sulfotelmatobacter sp.]|nr:lipoate--protein ligase family protein [Candidatus Sulfotelmatobacter sp.]
MKLLDIQLPSLAEQLAADEALLDEAENGRDGEMLLFWEPKQTFVVVGYANKVAMEVNLPACEKAGVPVFRRCSGGGTIVQMPGGLNYSLILRIQENSPTRNISSANNFIMEKNRVAIESVGRAVPSPPDGAHGVTRPTISVRGHTDLCVGDVKFAGNSQRRRKNFLLFHGTLLLNCDLNLVGDLLLMPSLAPDYRAGRSHKDFVTNLDLPAEKIKAALVQAWGAQAEVKDPPFAEIKKLALEKYSTLAWNFKF